jgi:hypothetical protein
MSFHATTPSTVTQNAVAIAIPLPTRPVARGLIHRSAITSECDPSILGTWGLRSCWGRLFVGWL